MLKGDSLLNQNRFLLTVFLSKTHFSELEKNPAVKIYRSLCELLIRLAKGHAQEFYSLILNLTDFVLDLASRL